ncbi:UxaA family hydrolase [Burkholderia lata]|uniref:UxaA family hydrolase n=1 Tax=Burkholderia lata (strain ATCC 17760 / DSM 23089 / LMG 22485 / NCIMB 9086 / R18194 / 383) TaxID=482957 RepID=UPI00145403E6|nr:altronate dehydratase family protein [Burkholderia lata]VWB87701.1 Altronate dehydratase [Burkholderia lata]
MTQRRTLHIHPDDNVVIALENAAPGDTIVGIFSTVQQPIAMGHKLALHDIAAGSPVRRYGQVIGRATQDIPAGSHVHVHNVAAESEQADAALIGVDARPTVYAAQQATFQGYRRSNGGVGTRNSIGIISTVNCSATAARAIADHFRNGLTDRWPNVDRVVALTHSSGCAIDPNGMGMRVLRRTLAGYARHPNFHSVILLGLGCEMNTMEGLLEQESLVPGEHLHIGSIQSLGGTRKAVDWGIDLVEQLLSRADRCRRETVSAAHLTVGTQCGGSDALSGVSANPVLGRAMDLLVAHGGSAVLSETVEVHGADQLLLRRCATPEVGLRLLRQLDDWRNLMKKTLGQVINVAPGNVQGGLTTSPEKSLGSFAKGGTTNVVAAIDYAEPATSRGLVYMDSPAFDPASVTGQLAAGCNLICFTTGRGSAFGSTPAPTVKVASNSPLYERQRDDMDFNAGTVLTGEENLETAGQRLFEQLLLTASGQRTCSEQWGYGEQEFTPWIPDPVL